MSTPIPGQYGYNFAHLAIPYPDATHVPVAPVGAPQPTHHRVLPWLVIGAVVAVAGIALALVLALTPGTITVSGTMTVHGYGGIGYQDIHDGAQVEVVNSKREVIALGRLESSVGSGEFSFTIPDVPADEDRYGVTVGNVHRGIVWADEADVIDGTLYFGLTLGDPDDSSTF
ncbi:hypothetical protein [Saccharomonospora sp. NB11]|jgi:hypothetical protein|uniref:hypothetical protein n=1 Tax=Saccharomonospora sp. NB11 TaxID=1642298 RepID=UPI0018D11199|nr:hypothetical protein [Saccharomonospora sp. NB11]